MEFIEEIKILENTLHHKEDFLTNITDSNVLLINIPKPSSTPLDELYIKAMTRYIASNTLSSYIVSAHEKILEDEILKRVIAENNIQLVINLCNSKETDFDVTYEQIQDKEMDYSLIKELEDAFHEANITKDKHGINENAVLSNLDIDVIQIAISENIRDLENPEKLKQVCEALINYIKMYTNYSD